MALFGCQLVKIRHAVQNAGNSIPRQALFFSPLTVLVEILGARPLNWILTYLQRLQDEIGYLNNELERYKSVIVTASPGDDSEVSKKQL